MLVLETNRGRLPSMSEQDIGQWEKKKKKKKKSLQMQRLLSLV